MTPPRCCAQLPADDYGCHREDSHTVARFNGSSMSVVLQ